MKSNILLMKRILNATAAVICIFAALTSCKNSSKEAPSIIGEEDTAMDSFDQDVWETEEPEEITPVETVEEYEDTDVDTPPTYSEIDTKPKFDGKEDRTFQKWVAENVVFPQQAVANNESGTVLVQFTIDSLGTMTDIKIIRSVSPSLDAEAVRVLEASPSWTSGSHEGKPVNISYMMPVRFSRN